MPDWLKPVFNRYGLAGVGLIAMSFVAWRLYGDLQQAERQNFDLQLQTVHNLQSINWTLDQILRNQERAKEGTP